MTSPFERAQRTYYTREINRGVPTTLPRVTDVTNAFVTDQAGLGASTSSFLSSFGIDSTRGVREADSACRGLPYPSPAMRDPDARTGCGWWYVSDPTRPSTGAFGTRRGPMDPTLDTSRGPGTWIWDPVEAEVLELLKLASGFKSCPDVVNAGNPQFAWCRATNAAVPVDATGAVRFSAADCTGQLVQVGDGVDACRGAQPQPGTTAAAAAANSTSSICSGGGPLTPQCLRSLVLNNGCSTDGALAKALEGGTYASADDTFSRTNEIMSRQFTLNESTYANGNTTVDAAIQDVQRLVNFANSADTGRSADAARGMCFSSDRFDLCSPADPGPYNTPNGLACIREYAINTDKYATDAGLFKKDPSFWRPYLTWDKVTSLVDSLQQTANTPPPAGADVTAYEAQQEAIYQVYGIRLPPVVVSCPTPQTSS